MAADIHEIIRVHQGLISHERSVLSFCENPLRMASVKCYNDIDFFVECREKRNDFN